MNSSPIFSPFVMDGLTRRGRMKSVPMVVLPRGLLYDHSVRVLYLREEEYCSFVYRKRSEHCRFL